MAELGEKLAELQARRDAAVTAVLDRLQPLEARLQEVAAREPAVDRLGERLAALGAALEAAEAGLAARLAAVEQGLGPDRQSEDAARAEAQAIATQLIAMHAAAAQTELFADRLALLEASLPRLSVTQSLMMQALERQAAAPEPVGAGGGGGPGAGAARGARPARGLPRPAAHRLLAPEVAGEGRGRAPPAGNRGLTNSADVRLRRPAPKDEDFRPWIPMPPIPPPPR